MEGSGGTALTVYDEAALCSSAFKYVHSHCKSSLSHRHYSSYISWFTKYCSCDTLDTPLLNNTMFPSLVQEKTVELFQHFVYEKPLRFSQF